MEHTEGEMGKLYFVRHGQTFWNVENKICGATNIALTPLGHEQAILTGKEILKAGILFDEIISSPLIRASETARHISEVTKKPMRLDARLTEQNFGRYESTARERIPSRALSYCPEIQQPCGFPGFLMLQKSVWPA